MVLYAMSSIIDQQYDNRTWGPIQCKDDILPV